MILKLCLLTIYEDILGRSLGVGYINMLPNIRQKSC